MDDWEKLLPGLCLRFPGNAPKPDHLHLLTTSERWRLYIRLRDMDRD